MGLFKKGADGYSTFGKLWRGAVSTYTQGVIDPLAMSQQNRALKASGGSAAVQNAQLEAVSAAAIAGSQAFISASGQASDPTTKAGVDYYIRKYALWIAGAVVAVGTVVVLLTRKKRGRR